MIISAKSSEVSKMSSKIYRQYDSRWSKKPYPTTRSSFGGNGCGCCSVLHLMIENPKYANYTPESIRPYFVKSGFAVSNQGTTWNGITEAMKHYGMKNIVRIWSQPMSEAWKVLDKGNKMGIILFRAGTKGGITWTSGGHYVAFTSYKKTKGKHYFYMKDSGGRKHDGWYCYETHMKGLVAKVWICDKPKTTSKPSTSKKAYRGAFPTGTIRKGSRGENVARWQKFINWYYGKTVVKVDKIFGNETLKYTKAIQKALKVTVDGIVGKDTLAKAKAFKK